jgi:hypothetical protein
MDLVLTLRWKDRRVIKLVTEGKSVVFAAESAKKLMWLPDISITNREFSHMEIISSTVSVQKKGRVTQTERMLVSLKDNFDVSAFPFDQQILHIRLGSSKLMLEDLLLKPMHGKELTGVDDGLFLGVSDFRLKNVTIYTYEDHDGSLRKSRGGVEIVIKRDSYPLVERIMIPELLLLSINWSAFFFPLLKQFIMPRFAACLLSFLMLITLSLRTNRMLPEDRSGFVWLEIFEECVETLMFFTICLHICVESIYHQWNCVELASRMTHELKFVFVAQALAVFIYTGMDRSGKNLAEMAVQVRVVLFGSAFAYIGYSFYRVYDKNNLGFFFGTQTEQSSEFED